MLGVPGPELGSASLNTLSPLVHLFSGGIFFGVLLCSRTSMMGDLMTGLEPQTRNELSSVVTIVQSSLEVTI